MNRKLEIDAKVLDTIEFVAIVFLAVVCTVSLFAIFTMAIAGGCAG